MQDIEILGNSFALVLLAITGLTGILALVSPRLFAIVVNYAGRAVSLVKSSAGTSRSPAKPSAWIDIDQFAIRYARPFGLLVTATVAYLWILVEDGPQACPKWLSVLIVGGSLIATSGAMLKIMAQKQQIATSLDTFRNMIEKEKIAATMAMSKFNIQKQQTEDRLNEAHTDKLTGLASRRAFYQELNRRLSQLQRQGTPHSLLVMNISHFKRVNETYGYQVGDAVLMQVAEILRASCRLMDLAARIGGDVFAVSLSGTNWSDASLAVERLQKAIWERPFVCDGREIFLTASMGLAEARSDDDAESLVKHADAALYAAKQAGRNRSFCQECIEPVPCS